MTKEDIGRSVVVHGTLCIHVYCLASLALVLRLTFCSVSKADCVAVPVGPNNEITISVRGSGSCAVIRMTAVVVLLHPVCLEPQTAEQRLLSVFGRDKLLKRLWPI
jgi:hypothetical protein